MHEETTGDPLKRIAAIKARLAHWDEELRRIVASAHDEGYTWRQIGLALGVSQQAVTLRFGGRREEDG